MPILSLELLPNFIKARLEASQTLKRILANIGWLFFDKIFRMGIGLFVGVWVARYLGPQQFGSLTYAAAFVVLLGAVANLGLENIVIRDIVREPEKKYEILASAFVLKLSAGAVAFCVSLAAIWMIRPSDSQSHLLVGIIAGGLIFQAFDTIDLWFQSQVQSKYTVCAKSGAFAIAALAKIFLILRNAPLITFAWVFLFEVVLGSIFIIIAYQITNHAIEKWRASWRKMKELLKDCWSLLLTGVAIMIYFKIDMIMLGNMVGDKEVGIYAAAVKISEIWVFIAVSIASTVYPIMIEYKKEDEGQFYAKFMKFGSLMAIISIFIALVITFLSNTIIQLVYGKNYSGAAPILSLHIWSIVFIFIAYPIAFLNIINGLQKTILVATIIGAIFNVVLNYYLIPLYSGYGAAASTVVSYGVAGYLSYFVFPKTRREAILLTKSIAFPWRYIAG